MPREGITDAGYINLIRNNLVSAPMSFSGTDVHATAFLNIEDVDNTHPAFKQYVRLGELQTITVSSNRGICPVRALGEHWVREYVKGTRTFAGSMIFSVLEKDVFSDILHLDKNENPGPYKTVSDQLPPITIGLSAINEMGYEASMFLYGVTLTNFGMALSVDDIFIETTYNYVAKWATPFVPGTVYENLKKLRSVLLEPNIRRASDLFVPRKSR